MCSPQPTWKPYDLAQVVGQQLTMELETGDALMHDALQTPATEVEAATGRPFADTL
jgi:hypothetical protein